MRRRDGLRMAGTAAAGLVLAACTQPAAPQAGQPAATSTGPTPSGPGGTTAAPTSGTSLPPLPPEVVNGPRDRPLVALTFHGQGDPVLAGQVLAALEARGAHVTIMAVGSWLATQPAMAHRVLDGGHELGNHTQNHVAISKLDRTHARAEIQQCADVLRSLTGSIGTWFRPSQTQHATATIQALATDVGYPTCLSYDLDSLDYTDPGPAAVTATTLGAIRNGSIVSMHLGHPGTLAALPAILDGLHSRGLAAVTMTKLMSG
jgi:peptidoglycan/xylan/chitin deacetylase (PgdA/CDA1 family)